MPPKAESYSGSECPKEAAFLALPGSFAVTAKPKLSLCMAARAPNPSAMGPLPTFRGSSAPLALLVYALALLNCSHLSL